MKNRCLNPTAKDFDRYGGRGIRLCENWLTFAGFLADMGRRPSDQNSIERIDNDGNYEPSNVKWGTHIEQQNNKRTNHLIEYCSRQMSIAAAVRLAGSLVSNETARNRIFRGWAPAAAVETPNSYRRDPLTRKIIREDRAE